MHLYLALFIGQIHIRVGFRHFAIKRFVRLQHFKTLGIFELPTTLRLINHQGERDGLRA
jgi:hypothetical protein